jgi:nitroreductase
MEFLDVVRKRRSIRKYNPEGIADDKLTNILEAARLAPSGSNRQSWKFIVVRDKEKKAKLAEACSRQTWIGDAAAAVVICYPPVKGIDDMRLKRDSTIAAEHIVLAATNEGLGSCWIGAFDQGAVKSLLSIPEEVGVNAVVAMGFPAEQPRQRTFKKLEDIVCYDAYRQ